MQQFSGVSGDYLQRSTCAGWEKGCVMTSPTCLKREQTTEIDIWRKKNYKKRKREGRQIERKRVHINVMEVKTEDERFGEPFQCTLVQTEVANGHAQMHWVDIALGLWAVPQQTDSQDWLRCSLAGWKETWYHLTSTIHMIEPPAARKRTCRQSETAGIQFSFSLWKNTWRETLLADGFKCMETCNIGVVGDITGLEDTKW